MSHKSNVRETAFQNNLEAILFVSRKVLISLQKYIFSKLLKPCF